jgi:hypothetical protein
MGITISQISLANYGYREGVRNQILIIEAQINAEF